MPARLTRFGGIRTVAPLAEDLSAKYGAIAQLGERNTGSVEVGSSILPGSTKHKPPDRVVFCLWCASRMLACRVGPQGHEELERLAIALSVILACF